MPLTDRFELLGLKRDEGARTFEAREIATGRPVFVHLFADPRAPINRALLARIDSLPQEEQRRIIDRGDHEGGVYIVTDRLAEYPGLREWLSQVNANVKKSLDAGGAWRILAPPPLPEQGNTEKFFDTAPQVPSAPEPAPVPESQLTNSGQQTLQIPRLPKITPREITPETPVPAAPSPQPEPGEFTRQFAPPLLRPAPAPAAPPPPKPNEPGEFTRQFAPPVLRPAPPPPAPVPPPASAPPVSSNEPGEFTRQFAPPVLRPAPKPPPPGPPSQEPGEFTRMLATPSAPAAPQKPPQGPGEFTRQFQAPQRPTPAPISRTPPAQPPQQDQPGEFTQMLQAQRPVTPPAPTKPPSSGEFSRLFQSPQSPASPHIVPLTPPHPPTQPRDAGEFTQVFGQGVMPAPPPPPTPAAPEPTSANATQVFSTPRPNLNIPAPTSKTAPQIPGEYTQMFAKPASLTFGQPHASPPTLRVPEPIKHTRNNSRLPLILLVGGAVLLIVALVVYLVMHQH